MIHSEIKSVPASNGEGLMIEVIGYFSLDLHNDFRRAYEDAGKVFRRYAINMQRCEGISSVGLGMLLLLKDYAQLDRDDLLIIHCPPAVRNVLNYSSFDQIFTILT